MAEAAGTTAKIAIALSLVAVITVGIAVVVVATREAPSATAAPAEPSEPVTSTVPRDHEHHTVRAADVVRLDRDTIEALSRGIKVTDRGLRTALSLESGDVITSISGRPVKRHFDVYDALLGASMMNATTLYIEIERGGAPKLVRWHLDGELREARKAAMAR